MTRHIALMVGLYLSASVVAAEPVAPTTVSTDNDITAVNQILAVSVPAQVLMDATVRAYDKGFQDHTRAALAPLEVRHPGITEHVRGDARETVRRIMVGNMPALMNRLRGIYLNGMTSAEIIDLRNFYSSTTGTKMAQAALKGVTGQALRDVGEVDLATGRGDALRSAVDAQLGSLSPEDMPVVTAFAKTSAAAKLPGLQPLQQQAVQNWLASMDASARSRVTAAINASIQRYTTSRPITESRPK